MSEVGNFAFHLGLVDYQERINVEKYLINGTLALENVDYGALHDIFDDCIDYVVEKGGNVNVYDIRRFGDYEETVAEYLHRSDIISLFAFNPEIRYGMQGDQVYMALYNDFMKSEVRRV